MVHWIAWARLFALVAVEKLSNGRRCFSASLIEFSSSTEVTSNQSQPTWYVGLFQFTCMLSKMSFLYLHSTDASTVTDRNCEIKSSCLSSVCEQTNPMTVFPGSNVTLNCSIVTEGLAQGMTWNQMLEQVRPNITGLPNLILERSNLTTNSRKHPCQCTSIHFTSRCFQYSSSMVSKIIVFIMILRKLV